MEHFVKSNQWLCLFFFDHRYLLLLWRYRLLRLQAISPSRLFILCFSMHIRRTREDFKVIELSGGHRALNGVPPACNPQALSCKAFISEESGSNKRLAGVHHIRREETSVKRPIAYIVVAQFTLCGSTNLGRWLGERNARRPKIGIKQRKGTGTWEIIPCIDAINFVYSGGGILYGT